MRRGWLGRERERERGERGKEMSERERERERIRNIYIIIRLMSGRLANNRQIGGTAKVERNKTFQKYTIKKRKKEGDEGGKERKKKVKNVKGDS